MITTTGPWATLSLWVSAAPPTGPSLASGRRACMPARHNPLSPCPAWKTSAATPGRGSRRTAAAPWPPCSRWSGYPISTSLLISPQDRWCPDWAASQATPHRSWATPTPCTRVQCLISRWAASAVQARESSRRPPACRATSTCTLTVSLAPSPRTSTTPCTASALCPTGMKAANWIPNMEERRFPAYLYVLYLRCLVRLINIGGQFNWLRQHWTSLCLSRAFLHDTDWISGTKNFSLSMQGQMHKDANRQTLLKKDGKVIEGGRKSSFIVFFPFHCLSCFWLCTFESMRLYVIEQVFGILSVEKQNMKPSSGQWAPFVSQITVEVLIFTWWRLKHFGDADFVQGYITSFKAIFYVSLCL